MRVLQEVLFPFRLNRFGIANSLKKDKTVSSDKCHICIDTNKRSSIFKSRRKTEQ